MEMPRQKDRAKKVFVKGAGAAEPVGWWGDRDGGGR